MSGGWAGIRSATRTPRRWVAHGARRWGRFSLALLGLAVAWGCQPSPPVSQAAQPAPPAAREYWDAVLFGDSQVGYVHTSVEPVSRDGRQLVRYRAESELTIERFNQSTRQKLQYSSLETTTGEVLEFDSSMSSGNGDQAAVSMESHGVVAGDAIHLKLSTLGKTQQAQLPWQKAWGGFFAMEQSLEKQPMRPGERRTLRALTPGFNQTAEVEFAAQDWEETTLLGTDMPAKLLKIATVVKLGTNKLEQTVWTNERGESIKTLMPALQQTTYRTTREKAMAKSRGTFDLGERSIVRVNPPLKNPHRTKRIEYRATLEQGQPAESLARGATQAVRKTGDHSAEIIVRVLGPKDDLGIGFPQEVPPAAADLSPNNLIQSDDAEIVRLAEDATRGVSDPWEMAVALESRVHETITRKNFSQALSSAAEVVRSKEGDCTEHAVLLAALCRARKIPARVVIGLVYHPPSDGFAYHMWTSVWIRDRWLPLDATLGQGGIGAAHIAVSQSNLDGADPLAHFLPVVQLIGSLKLEVLRVE